MLPLRATLGIDRLIRIDARSTGNTMRVRIHELRAAVVVRAERELRLRAAWRGRAEQLVVAADAREIDDRLAVGRPGRRRSRRTRRSSGSAARRSRC